MFKRREIQIKQKREKLMLRHKNLLFLFYQKIIILFAKEKSDNFLPVDEKKNVFSPNFLKKEIGC